jgi:L-type amino acid transporter 9
MTTESTSKRRDNPDDGPTSTDRENNPPPDEVSLKRLLGIPGASSLVAGIMIGSGIFVSARWVLVYSGSVGLALIIWLLCALVTFIGGLCWVELGLTFPKCGGKYDYVGWSSHTKPT